MIERIWRYSINEGDYGGIVFAYTKKAAELKVRRKYPIGDICVWLMINDDYFDDKNPEILECYGM